MASVDRAVLFDNRRRLKGPGCKGFGEGSEAVFGIVSLLESAVWIWPQPSRIWCGIFTNRVKRDVRDGPHRESVFDS
ncbi:hypothetical protein RRF57_001461 [Xylaria bambusicola]|uniref:Uncharacterized protein n=1 Tax=Xylaria bambusicola TaxID=326684 RepID=A0AAN7YUY2_9PEZI